MFYIILISFFCMISAILASSSTSISGFKLNNKHTKIILDILVCYLVGFIFVILEYLFMSGSPDMGNFSFDMDFFDASDWRWGRNNSANFFFAGLITYFIIWIKRKYKGL